MATAAAGALVAGLFVVTPVQAQENDDGPPNLVQNGNFTPPVDGQWWGITDADVADGALCVTVPDVERFGNFVNLGLAEGQTYRFGFTAWGDPGTGGLEARIQSDGAAGPEIFDVQEVFEVWPEPQQFQWDFVSTDELVQRVQFELAGATDTSELCMSDVFVMPINEVLQNPTFDGQDPWWTTDNLELAAGPDGGMCTIVPATENQWDAIIGQNDVVIEEGNSYAVTLTASADPDSPVRILIPDPAADWPPVYFADLTLPPDGTTFTDTFEAEVDSDQFQIQVGGTAEPYELCLFLASLTTGGEIPEFEFTLPGLIKIRAVKRPATKKRMGRNPATGEEIVIPPKPASVRVRATALKRLKEMVS
jgi:endoglucanase